MAPFQKITDAYTQVISSNDHPLWELSGGLPVANWPGWQAVAAAAGIAGSRGPGLVLNALQLAVQRMAVEQRGAALDLAGVEAQEQQLQASLQENAREALMATFCAPAREAASSMQQYQHAQQPHQSRLADQQAHIQASAGNVQQPLPSSRLAGPAPSMQVPTAALDIAASQLDEEILTEQPAFCILAHRSMQRGRRSELEYLVHFPGYADEQDVWENASRVRKAPNGPQAIAHYEASMAQDVQHTQRTQQPWTQDDGIRETEDQGAPATQTDTDWPASQWPAVSQQPELPPQPGPSVAAPGRGMGLVPGFPYTSAGMPAAHGSANAPLTSHMQPRAEPVHSGSSALTRLAFAPLPSDPQLPTPAASGRLQAQPQTAHPSHAPFAPQLQMRPQHAQPGPPAQSQHQQLPPFHSFPAQIPQARPSGNHLGPQHALRPMQPQQPPNLPAWPQQQPLQAGGDEPTDAEACTAEEAAAAAWGRARQASGRSPQDRGLDYAPRPAFPGSQAAPRNVQHAPATQPAQAVRQPDAPVATNQAQPPGSSLMGLAMNAWQPAVPSAHGSARPSQAAHQLPAAATAIPPQPAAVAAVSHGPGLGDNAHPDSDDELPPAPRWPTRSEARQPDVSLAAARKQPASSASALANLAQQQQQQPHAALPARQRLEPEFPVPGASARAGRAAGVAAESNATANVPVLPGVPAGTSRQPQPGGAPAAPAVRSPPPPASSLASLVPLAVPLSEAGRWNEIATTVRKQSPLRASPAAHRRPSTMQQEVTDDEAWRLMHPEVRRYLLDMNPDAYSEVATRTAVAAGAGRPAGPPQRQQSKQAEQAQQVQGQTTDTAAAAPAAAVREPVSGKRPRGRPRKNPAPAAAVETDEGKVPAKRPRAQPSENPAHGATAAAADEDNVPAKRLRGRPRKHPAPSAAEDSVPANQTRGQPRESLTHTSHLAQGRTPAVAAAEEASHEELDTAGEAGDADDAAAPSPAGEARDDATERVTVQPQQAQHAARTEHTDTGADAEQTREAEVIDVSSPAAPQTDGGMPAIARNAVGAGPGQKRGAVPIAGAGPSWESPAPEATAPSIKQERAAPGTERRGSATNGSDRERDAAGGQGPAAGRPPITLKQEHLVEPAGGSTLVDNDQFIDAREDTPSDDEALEEEMRLQALLAAVKPETMRRLDEGWERAMITGARKEGGSLRLRVVWIETPEYEDYVDLLVLRSKPQCRVELIDFFVTKIKPSNPRRSRRTSGEEGDQPVTVE